jgi:hypothetical protein
MTTLCRANGELGRMHFAGTRRRSGGTARSAGRHLAIPEVPFLSNHHSVGKGLRFLREIDLGFDPAAAK